MTGASVAAALLADACLITGIILLGVLVSRLFDGSDSPLASAALAFPLGAGLLTWAVFLASWGGVYLDRLGIVLVWATCMTIAVALNLAFGRSIRARARPAGSSGQQHDLRRRPLLVLGLILIGAAGLVTGIISVARSYSTWDAMAIWSVKGYGIALKGTIFAAADWGAHGLSYPLNQPLQIALFRLAGGDLFADSKILYPLYYVALLLGCLGFWCSRGVRDHLAVLGVALVGFMPVVFEHATIGYANLPFSSYLVLGTAAAVSGISDGVRSRQILSGILLALAAWTRPEGMLVVVSIDLVLAVAWICLRRGRIPLGAWLIPQVVVIGSWALFTRLYVPGGEMAVAVSAAADAIMAGHPHLSALLLILRRLARLAFTPQEWGTLAPCALVLLLGAAAAGRKRWQYDGWALLGSTAIVGSAMVAYYFLTSFIGELPFWKDSDFSRMFLPAEILLAVTAVLVAGRHTRGPREATEDTGSKSRIPERA